MTSLSAIDLDLLEETLTILDQYIDHMEKLSALYQAVTLDFERRYVETFPDGPPEVPHSADPLWGNLARFYAIFSADHYREGLIAQIEGANNRAVAACDELNRLRNLLQRA